MVFSPLKFLTPFNLLVLSVPVFMVYLRSIKMMFLCNPSYLWLVLRNEMLPVGFHRCFNLCWSTLVVSALKILFLFLRLLETLAQLICLCAPLTFVPFTQTFLLMKPLEFVVMSYCVVLLLNLPFQRVFKHLINFATFSVEFSFNNIMYRQTDGVAMESSLGPTLENIFVGFCEASSLNKIDSSPCIIVMLTTLSVYLKMRKMLIYFSHI